MTTKTFDIKLNDTIVGLANTSWDPNGVVSGRAATEDQLSKATEQLPLIVAGGSSAETEVLPNSRKNFQFDLGNLPANYVIGAYRQISIAGQNFQNVFIQTFSTTGGGRKANISVFNTGSESARVTISVSTICMRQMT